MYTVYDAHMLGQTLIGHWRTGTCMVCCRILRVRLVAGAVFFTFYMGFVNLRGFKHAIQLVRGDYADPDSAAEVSHF